MNTSLSKTDYQMSTDRTSLTVTGHQSESRTSPPPPDPRQSRRHITRLQRTGAALIAGACVLGAAWYIPYMIAVDGSSLTGTVTSDGLIYLTFASSGQLAKVSVQIGQQVRQGQLLATEAAPAAVAIVAADRATITSDQAQLTAALAAGQATGIAAARARLADDRAQLAIDHAKVVGTRIVAPAAGTVVAVNGQPGEIAGAQGIRDYSSLSAPTPVTLQPLFSLLPEGPQSAVQTSGPAAARALPVVALRTSSAWQVIALIPESSVMAVKPGQAVTIDVPAARIAAIPGRIEQLLAPPITTSQGMAYQAIVTVLGHHATPPPSGLAANVHLDS